MTSEEARLEQATNRTAHWKRWGPYLSERAWGTVREDYSAHGTAWECLPHDHARSKAYRWNEDGIAGICDRHQKICFAPALWNGRDPILKERFFGLTGNEGNHGEDVKECYYYLDSTPTHSYQSNPHWQDLALFYEYFHGDDGSGVGASHQTGWTGLVAKLLQQSGELRCDSINLFVPISRELRDSNGLKRMVLADSFTQRLPG